MFPMSSTGYPKMQTHHEMAGNALHLPLHRVPRNDLSNVLISDVPVSNSQEFAYLVRLDIGGQNFWLTFDTGSSDLWVVSSNCTNLDCQNVPGYSPTSSLSLSDKSFKLNYLLGSVEGYVGSETVALGQYQILSQTFAMANETNGLNLANTGNSGILGLSFPLAASIPSTTGQTLLSNLFSYFDDSQRFFAYKLGRNGTKDSATADSSLTIGQLDGSIANDTSQFSFTPVYGVSRDVYDYWKLPIHGLTINSQSFPLSRSTVPGARDPIAVLDTGTTLILGPTNDVNVMWTAIGTGGSTRYNQATQLWEVRCERAIDIRFNLGDSDTAKEYAVHPEDINWSQEGMTDDWCTGGIQANDEVNSGDWLLGDIFLRNVYVIHQGATSSKPPMIGLLNLTNPDTAMSQFKQTRGSDTWGPPSIQARNTTSTGSHVSADLACAFSAFGGYFVGAAATAIYQLRRRSRRKKVRLY